uniref:NB-ARC domain-containing protein n=1 Tax=Oryza punctata TaxID=4537 RepID=A0A0E0MKK7_ORYPU
MALVFAGKAVATAAISFWINKAFTYLKEYKVEGMEDIKNRLLQSMPKIQVVLDIVNPRYVKEQSSALDAWLWQLRHAVEEAEDVIDVLEYYKLKEVAKDHKVSDWGSSFSKVKHKVIKSVKHVSILDKNLKQFTHRGTLKRLREAVEGLDKVASDIMSILTVTEHLKEVASCSEQREYSTNDDRATGSTLTPPKFVGREKETEKIVRWLTKASTDASGNLMSTNHVPILSLIGHGGMGKTTLAQHIRQEMVSRNFKVIWVCVSNSFHVTSLTSKILESALGAKPNADCLETLQQDLIHKLKYFTDFLLVLDDVWEDKRKDKWEKLFAPLRTGKSGSKILLTTRMHSVAALAANAMGIETEFLTIEGLEEGENLELFNHSVFSGQNPQDFPNLKLVGEQIAKKLGGCPLVTKVVGGHLRSNMSFQHWNNFFQEGLEHFKGSECDIVEVLRLSYYCLPTELQICFRYCSIFPQDYEFRMKDLVLMWIGSGLISQDGNKPPKRLEDIGEQILAQLVGKSFFETNIKVDQYSQRKEKYYIMHDLMHELARYVSSGECARIISPVENVMEQSKSLRLLRSNLENTFHLPKIAHLKHLRYIDLPRISPDTIFGLVELYHLLLVKCFNGSREEPKQVRYLGNIDHLRYVNNGKIGEFPIGRLTSLQELHNYRVVQGGKGNKISAIGNLSTLRELEVLGLENVESHEEADDVELNKKKYITLLSLAWSARPAMENGKDELLLNSLEPHANIETLRISGYGGVRSPIWIENLHVKNLVSLELARCLYWGKLPSLGELVSLKHLWLECLPSLQQIGQSSDVSSSSCVDLSLPPNLDTMIVRRCKELRALPILPTTLVHFETSNVGLTKLPRIGKECNENLETKSSRLLLIVVEECKCLNSLEESLLVQGDYIKSIHVLRIADCEDLEAAPLAFEQMDELRELDIRNCPKLRTSRGVGGRSLPLTLQKLNVNHCGELELPLIGSLQGLTHLSELVLEKCKYLESLPSDDVFKSLKSLKILEIIGCENLSSLGGLGSLQYLLELKISACSKLMAIGSSQTPDTSSSGEEPVVVTTSTLQIDYLEIDLPDILHLEPLKGLCHTKGLVIRGGTQLESLPEEWLLQNRGKLQSLKILSASSLESLPLHMRDLCSLNFLILCGAGKLQSLPDFPSSLQKLYVICCCQELENKLFYEATFPSLICLRQIGSFYIPIFSYHLNNGYSLSRR